LTRTTSTNDIDGSFYHRGVPPASGIRVLDLSRVLAGPYCTMLLADLGADVVKVERPGEGDETRTWGPPYAGGEAAYFLAVNRGKRSVAVDLARAEGRELAQRLARSADVVVENFRAGTADRLGLGYEELSREHPGLVYCSITGFGSARLPAGRPGYDFVIQAESGLMAITGDEQGAPSKVGVAVVDVLAGYAAATSILAALVGRAETGRGERIEISLLDTALSALVNVGASALVTGAEPGRYGNAHPNIVPYQTFEAADGVLAVAAANDGLYRRLCDAIERPELADDDRFRTNPARVTHREALVRELAAVFAARRADEWIARLDAAGVPAGKARGVLDALAEAERAGRPATLTVEHPTAGRLRLVASPVAPAEASPRPPPLLGEHTRDVLAELGVGAAEAAALERDGVVASAPTGDQTDRW
jgi:crotonobetainyl-CoA:carnitine CoA-transferase CaiB-like acyl-CoA transferase